MRVALQGVFGGIYFDALSRSASFAAGQPEQAQAPFLPLMERVNFTTRAVAQAATTTMTRAISHHMLSTP